MLPFWESPLVTTLDRQVIHNGLELAYKVYMNFFHSLRPSKGEGAPV
jgi:hypothetical protein